MINNENYKDYNEPDLLQKLEELDIKRMDGLSEEEYELRNNILGILEGVVPSELTVTAPSSSSVEDTLELLGNVVIVIGIIAGILCVFLALLEEQLYVAMWGIAVILSSFISGYILKGLSKIIALLSSLQDTNSDD
jgi:ABC-type Co2+ transport system permease subunit